METLEIHADAREKIKKRDAKRLLRSGKIPGILYGPKMQSVSLEFDWRSSKTCCITRLAAMSSMRICMKSI